MDPDSDLWVHPTRQAELKDLLLWLLATLPSLNPNDSTPTPIISLTCLM
ncbi:uncharacterized protein G2W53_037808 [Senna tora]|uniref:Uncharacterized protein n=1 Tax=Senna tora TaxID=362788 RepID=A0A834SKZ9_9FABA|nr:uncharacterized protein G2W53_037808 [Senna tora]